MVVWYLLWIFNKKSQRELEGQVLCLLQPIQIIQIIVQSLPLCGSGSSLDNS